MKENNKNESGIDSTCEELFRDWVMARRDCIPGMWVLIGEFPKGSRNFGVGEHGMNDTSLIEGYQREVGGKFRCYRVDVAEPM